MKTKFLLSLISSIDDDKQLSFTGGTIVNKNGNTINSKSKGQGREIK